MILKDVTEFKLLWIVCSKSLSTESSMYCKIIVQEKEIHEEIQKNILCILLWNVEGNIFQSPGD